MDVFESTLDNRNNSTALSLSKAVVPKHWSCVPWINPKSLISMQVLGPLPKILILMQVNPTEVWHLLFYGGVPVWNLCSHSSAVCCIWYSSSHTHVADFLRRSGHARGAGLNSQMRKWRLTKAYILFKVTQRSRSGARCGLILTSCILPTSISCFVLIIAWM